MFSFTNHTLDILMEKPPSQSGHLGSKLCSLTFYIQNCSPLVANVGERRRFVSRLMFCLYCPFPEWNLGFCLKCLGSKCWLSASANPVTPPPTHLLVGCVNLCWIMWTCLSRLLRASLAPAWFTLALVHVPHYFHPTHETRYSINTDAEHTDELWVPFRVCPGPLSTLLSRVLIQEGQELCSSGLP